MQIAYRSYDDLVCRNLEISRSKKSLEVWLDFQEESLESCVKVVDDPLQLLVQGGVGFDCIDEGSSEEGSWGIVIDVKRRRHLVHDVVQERPGLEPIPGQIG